MRSEKEELLSLLQEKHDREKYNRFHYLYPENDNLDFSASPQGKLFNRSLYSKHLEFFKAGKTYRQRLFCAGNRVGKSFSGLYELVAHATGLYPSFWEGKEFHRPVTIWIGGFTLEMMKSSVMEGLLGRRGEYGSGLLPKESLIETRIAPGVPDAVSTVKVQHKSGGISTIHFKSYESGLEGFAGAAVDFIMLDEEPPLKVYTECLMRTATTNGSIIVTFTPDRGFSETVLSFFENGEFHEGAVGSKYVVVCGWEDVPHLSDEFKSEAIKSMLPHEIEAKTRGIPYLGSGAVYPIPEHEIKVRPFEIPIHWPRAYGMDVGWNKTAAIFAAQDPDTKVTYLYSEYYRGMAEPAVHAAAIKTRGAWLEGVIDKASLQKTQSYGDQLFILYQDQGLNIYSSSEYSKNKEGGILRLFQMLSEGRLKVFGTCQNWFNEFRIYRRDDKGEIVKKNDHLMDATRYLVDALEDILTVNPEVERRVTQTYEETQTSGRSDIGGY